MVDVMRTLLILRHAKSSRDDPSLDDHDRPLNKRGERDSVAMGRLVREEKLVPDIIISSTAARARMTIQKMAKACRYTGDIRYSARLYPGATADYVKELRKVAPKNERVMIVGHNPGLEEFLTRLTGTPEHLCAGALARLQLPVNDWKKFTARTKAQLIRIYEPRGI
ncbi:MAG: histidine phosphatase family protein [Candidatus Omnitrophica bacterium]|nr:histidine phosphatase family protein [Candidatus Omnitrophota bacterium]